MQQCWIHFKQTNKGNLLETRPRSIHAITTLPLATLQTKINPPLLFLSGKCTQILPSAQAPPEDGTSGRQQQICASSSEEHWPAFIMDHSRTLECRLTNTSKLWFFPSASGLIFLNYQIWLKVSVLKWHCDTSNQQGTREEDSKIH